MRLPQALVAAGCVLGAAALWHGSNVRTSFWSAAVLADQVLGIILSGTPRGSAADVPT
jgi:hypothetical protein